jgi:hypothetical protein
MKKMPCLFVREFHSHSSFTITKAVTPGCEWVLAGEGQATRKWDGTACAVIGGVLYKRLDCKKDRKTGEYKPPPLGAKACDDPDPVTGHWPHWVPVGIGPEDKWHRAALEVEVTHNGKLPAGGWMADGTYELCGPHFQANPQGFEVDAFVPHGVQALDLSDYSPLTFESVRMALADLADWEGFVFHHPDGRMCKIRRADFGLPWPVRS